MFDQKTIEGLVNTLKQSLLHKWAEDIEKLEDLASLHSLIIKFTPVEGNIDKGYTYIHKSIYEFYVQQSFNNEVS